MPAPKSSNARSQSVLPLPSTTTCNSSSTTIGARRSDKAPNGSTFGQEDLAAADIAAIKTAGIRIGISTHNEEELETALAAGPDYVALGPIWETKLKAMKWAPQGLDRIASWKARIGSLPLVAIGGITPERADSVIAAGANSVAVITDFFMHADPEFAWLNGFVGPRH